MKIILIDLDETTSTMEMNPQVPRRPIRSFRRVDGGKMDLEYTGPVEEVIHTFVGEAEGYLIYMQKEDI